MIGREHAQPHVHYVGAEKSGLQSFTNRFIRVVEVAGIKSAKRLNLKDHSPMEKLKIRKLGVASPCCASLHLPMGTLAGLHVWLSVPHLKQQSRMPCFGALCVSLHFRFPTFFLQFCPPAKPPDREVCKAPTSAKGFYFNFHSVHPLSGKTKNRTQTDVCPSLIRNKWRKNAHKADATPISDF